MKINKSIIVLLSAVLMSGIMSSCSNPLDKTYNKHTAEDDMRRIRELDKLDSADMALLSKYMVDHQLIGHHLLEAKSSYMDLLLRAKREKEIHDIEMKKSNKDNQFAQIQEKEKMRNFNKILQVRLIQEDLVAAEPVDEKKWVKPGTVPATPKNVLTYRITFKNISDKPVAAFKGDVSFFDRFLSELGKTTISDFNEIAPGDSIVQSFQLDLDEVNKKKGILSLGLKRENIKIDWHPERLIFTDNTIIE